MAPPAGSHLLALQLQDAAECITGLRQLLHLLLLCLVELEWEVAAVTGGGGGSSGTRPLRMGSGGTHRVEGHSQLLNEGVEVLGSLPAVLEETGHLFHAIKMQMGRMEKKRLFSEDVAGMAAAAWGSCSCLQLLYEWEMERCC